ncbi:MAG TPA: hypothetical protein VNK46_08435 [Nitrospiraceae bacterium]|jgi:hypothetical protein|nr:hypothetical protein [Nitrospiraceae bacterium]
MNTSHDGQRCSHIKGCSAKSLGKDLFVGFLLVCIMGMGTPLTVFAGEQRGDRDEERYRLINQRLKAKIEALRNKIKEHKREQHNNAGGGLVDLQAQVTDLQSKVAALTSAQESLLNLLGEAQNQIGTLQMKVNTLESGGGTSSLPPSLTALSKYLAVDPNPINGLNGPHVILTGVNLHVRSGSGSTGDNGTPTGLGNLIVGYNEGPHPTGGRTGSHNLIGGTLNAFTSSGGLVFGSRNWISRPYAAILGGEGNQAEGLASSILGGRGNWLGSSYSYFPSTSSGGCAGC